MKILLAADGSKFTKKALAFLVTHESLAGAEDEIFVLNVQVAVPGRVKSMLGSAEVAAYHQEEANKVLDPIKRFLDRHGLPYRCAGVVGLPVAEILKAAKREKSHLLVMGTHGHKTIKDILLGTTIDDVRHAIKIPLVLV